MWVLSKLATIWIPKICLGVVMTGREISLMAAIGQVFPSSSHVLCIWHINMDVLAKCETKYETSEAWTMFLQH